MGDIFFSFLLICLELLNYSNMFIKVNTAKIEL